MKAIVFNEYGGPEVLHYSEVSDPSAGPGEIVVNVHAASINRVDDKIRSGGAIDKALFPHILGETVLIHGAAGGVGTFAVQLARHLGAKVIGTASSANQHYVQRLGAHQVIDYSAEDFRLVAPLCDVVFDTVGGETQVLSYDVLKPSGRLVWIASAPPGFVPPRKDVWAQRPDVRRDRAHLRRVLDLLEVRAVSPPKVQTFVLRDAAEAHRVAAMRHVMGKLVLTTSMEGEL